MSDYNISSNEFHWFLKSWGFRRFPLATNPVFPMLSNIFSFSYVSFRQNRFRLLFFQIVQSDNEAKSLKCGGQRLPIAEES